MTDASTVQKCEIALLTKRDFNSRRTSQFFAIEPSVEEKLNTFQDDDILAIEIAIDSPAVVKNILDGKDVISLMQSRLYAEGISQDQINQSLKGLLEG